MRANRVKRISVLFLVVVFLASIGVATVLAPYQYTFFGLYSEDGTYSGTTDVTVYFDNETSTSFTVGVTRGYALDFDPTGNEYLDIPTSNTLDLQANTTWTVTFWIRMSETSSATRDILRYLIDANNRIYIRLQPSSDVRFIHEGNTADRQFDVDWSPYSNVWTWICWSWNSTAGNMVAYVNNVVGGSETGLQDLVGANTNIHFGHDSNDLDGIIDEIQMYNRTLTSSERAQIYNVGYGLYDGASTPNGHWHLDEGTGNVTADASGYGNNATLGTGLANMPSWVSGHVWDAYTVEYSTIPVGFEWNVSYVNVSRYFIPTGDVVEAFWLFDLDATGEDYLFTVYAYQALLPAWLETARHVNDTERLIERRTINATQNQVPMVMVTGATYFIQIRGSDGTTYDFGIFVPGSNDPTLRLNPISFSSRIQMAYRYLQVEGTRNSTNERITVNANDSLNETTWIDLEIQYKNGTIAWESNTTYPGPTIQFQWNNADNATNYIGVLEISHTSFGNMTHQMSFPLNPSYGQPFNLTFLGTTPAGFPQSDLISIGIVFSVAAVFSTVTAPIGGFMIVLTAATLYQLGWVNWSTDLMIMAMALVVMFTVHRARRGG